MEGVNVFVKSEKETFGLIVPLGCKYVQFVDMLRNQMKIEKPGALLGIEYVVDVDMAPIKITNDYSMTFYLELKRKDPRVTAYALRVEEVTMSSNNECETSPQMLIQNFNGMNRNDELGYSSVQAPTLEEFVSTLCLDYTDMEKEELHSDIDSVVTHPDADCIIENQLFRDKKILKAAIALHAIRNQFQYRIYKSDKREYVLKCQAESCKWRFRASNQSRGN